MIKDWNVEDVVLDSERVPVFSGTPEQTSVWIKTNQHVEEVTSVCLGESMDVISVSDYLSRAEN